MCAAPNSASTSNKHRFYKSDRMDKRSISPSNLSFNVTGCCRDGRWLSLQMARAASLSSLSFSRLYLLNFVGSSDESHVSMASNNIRYLIHGKLRYCWYGKWQNHLAIIQVDSRCRVEKVRCSPVVYFFYIILIKFNLVNNILLQLVRVCSIYSFHCKE